ncbi:arabinogalactan oligomer/maltooligosaccharide transport system substrate-binding protein [Natronobacillus azotifigens]|uniref:Maltodextrin-binding protein n=1 Tax=Natronobacillus azotifigens TaxID=472978 RepID=A0A9J6R904_9BACI|nr:extracellular solute-binding protein [Natronobacillus azotifigens]MCZ0702146.1 extracellular solute-binding protein [Natronobacillus azotifigens]
MLTLKKRTIGLLLLVASLLFIAACAPDREEVVEDEDRAEGEMPEKPDELVVWINDEDIAEDVHQEQFDRYTEETGIEIVLERIAMPDQLEELALAGPGGTGPDLFFQPQDRLGDAVVQGLAVPFSYTDEELADFSDAAIDAFTYEGDIYGAPVAIETYFAYYNRSLLDEVPETIEDVLDMSLDIRAEDSDMYGFLITPEFYYLYSFINGYGGYVFAEEDGVYDPDDIGLDSEGAIEGMEMYQSFITEGAMPRTITPDVLDGLFIEGRAAMVVSGPWNLPHFREALGDDLGTAPLPVINNEPAPSFVGVKSWLVSFYSNNQEWAEDLAKFLTNDENSQYYYDITGELPPRPDILDTIDDPIYAGYTEQVEFGTPMPNIPQMSPVWDMDEAIELIVNGNDVEEVLEEAVQNIKDKIELQGGQ